MPSVLSVHDGCLAATQWRPCCVHVGLCHVNLCVLVLFLFSFSLSYWVFLMFCILIRILCLFPVFVLWAMLLALKEKNKFSVSVSKVTLLVIVLFWIQVISPIVWRASAFHAVSASLISRVWRCPWNSALSAVSRRSTDVYRSSTHFRLATRGRWWSRCLVLVAQRGTAAVMESAVVCVVVVAAAVVNTGLEASADGSQNKRHVSTLRTRHCWLAKQSLSILTRITALQHSAAQPRFLMRSLAHNCYTYLIFLVGLLLLQLLLYKHRLSSSSYCESLTYKHYILYRFGFKLMKEYYWVTELMNFAVNKMTRWNSFSYNCSLLANERHGIKIRENN